MRGLRASRVALAGETAAHVEDPDDADEERCDHEHGTASSRAGRRQGGCPNRHSGTTPFPSASWRLHQGVLPANYNDRGHRIEMRIRILVTGGTFDKQYDELTGRLF